MIWKDYNGNEHFVSDNIELKLQQPNCKYLCPCGICSLLPDLKTCSMMIEVKKNDRK